MDNSPIQPIGFSGPIDRVVATAQEWLLSRFQTGFKVKIVNSCQSAIFGPNGLQITLIIFYQEEKDESKLKP